MHELLFGTWWASWGSPALAYSQKHPWVVFAAILAGILLLDLMFGKRRYCGDAGFSDWDCSDGDGGGGGD
jgi:hypothetical protein